MAWTAFAIAALLAGVLATLRFRRSDDAVTDDWVVEPLRLGGLRERELLAQLRVAFPQNPVFVHVSLAKLLRMRRSRGSTRAFQRYYRMAAPFVVCSKDLMPVVVVDVVGAPGTPSNSREQQARAAAVRAAGLVYVAVALEPAVPVADELRRLVRAALKSKAATVSPPGPHGATVVPAATILTTGSLPRRTPPGVAPSKTSAAPPFPKPAHASAALAAPLAAAGGMVRRIFRTTPARPSAPPAPRSRVA
jgi:hypothetical protein